MLSNLGDSAHDAEHIYRVLNNALLIAQQEPEADMDIVIAACLLHDVGRPDQLADASLCHAQVGSQKALAFLLEQGFPESFARHVSSCVRTHRFRKSMPPESLEAKILFDADKLDVTGAIGIARTLVYKGTVVAPLYRRNEDGSIDNGEQELGDSFFREYKFKLEKLYDRFYTQAGAAMAQQRKDAAVSFYESLYREVNGGYTAGQEQLDTLLK